ncbi:hypothetical protein CCACVL1_27105 [Corchorus capsularis]|uniref:ARID domain-containing protein n=1 Tax=Corchorus capsularis TaxID=210143 RepID=A0A1R3GC44_COCAP|nr:hypothetical protein CCACVL1_27105 [Corchorus capsularis]
MESNISDTRGNRAEQAVPGTSDMNEGGHPINPHLRERPSFPASLPLEANSIPSHADNINADDNIKPHSTPPHHSPSLALVQDDQGSLKTDVEIPSHVKYEYSKDSDSKKPVHAKRSDSPLSYSDHISTAEPTTDVRSQTSFDSVPEQMGNAKPITTSALPQSKIDCDDGPIRTSPNEPELLTPGPSSSNVKLVKEKGNDFKSRVNEVDLPTSSVNGNSKSKLSFLLDDIHFSDGNESGTEEEQLAFMKQLEVFFKARGMEFKPPKFYGEGLNCLKLWRAVTRLGGYDKVTSCKLWRQVGESFNPPKTCTTVSWTFRGFYEKALLDYERHKTLGGELNIPISSQPEPANVDNQASGSGRARRDAATRAMQGWHSQRHLRNGEVSDPIIKDKNSMSLQKREKQLKSLGLLKRKKPSYFDHAAKAAHTKASKAHVETAVVDIGPPADWVKINVQKTKECFEVYALVPGLLREEVRVQSDPAGRLVISGEPLHPDNPWGVTPFKKVVSLPSRIDPHQTSAVVTLHGQLFVRVPFQQS